jgi:hypothetical protein
MRNTQRRSSGGSLVERRRSTGARAQTIYQPFGITVGCAAVSVVEGGIVEFFCAKELGEACIGHASLLQNSSIASEV